MPRAVSVRPAQNFRVSTSGNKVRRGGTQSRAGQWDAVPFVAAFRSGLLCFRSR
jgi:hypothetical protein